MKMIPRGKKTRPAGQTVERADFSCLRSVKLAEHLDVIRTEMIWNYDDS